MLLWKSLIVLINLINTVVLSSETSNGFILYCPCMGRFGNQADHFLGVLGFSKGLNRTLVLPPWVEYKYGAPKSVQIPFITYFELEPLLKFQKVITMEKFMAEIAPVIWPPEKRTVFCYVPRGNNSCSAKEGNPFGPFWDTFNIDFVASEFYSPLHYDIYQSSVLNSWEKRYPPEKWPVLAFAGAPATFPVQKKNKDLQKYLIWSNKINEEVDHFIKKSLPKGAFIAIHLRNGIDWVRACEHVNTSPSLFSAPQCFGYLNEYGEATKEVCLPSVDTIVKQLKRLIRKSTNEIVAIVIASDSNHMVEELTKQFRRTNVKLVEASGSSPHIDLAIMGRANYFIGNCISSFSAFVVRERQWKGLPSEFWAFPPIPTSHDEL